MYDIRFVYRRTDRRTRWNQYTPLQLRCGGNNDYKAVILQRNTKLENVESDAQAQSYSGTQIIWVENNNIQYTKDTLIKAVIEVMEEVDVILTNKSTLYIYVHLL